MAAPLTDQEKRFAEHLLAAIRKMIHEELAGTKPEAKPRAS